MSVSEMFSEFLSNLVISNTPTISMRYRELTKALNKEFRNTESETANCLQVGSFGRKTGINGISDLDMLYVMPKAKWDDYNVKGGQSRLLSHARDAILERYPRTKVRVDRLVVTVTYADFHVEVQPVFEQDDGSYKYPDTKNGGSWKITKPRAEMDAIAELNQAKNSNLRRLCKMVRAWRNKHGVVMGGLLIDTLVYNFLESTTEYDTRSFMYYDRLSRDFFKYLSELPIQTEYAAPGSRQRVKVKRKFQNKAQTAYDLCLDAIKAENQSNVNEKWKKVFGRSFPAAKVTAGRALVANDSISWRNTEEFIEDFYPVDIREYLKIDCKVTQDGYRPTSLREMLFRGIFLQRNKKLNFMIKHNAVKPPYKIYWKVLNRGVEAQRRDCIRGQITEDDGRFQKEEHTRFQGEHLVECYCLKEGVVVARDQILVPIQS